MARHLFGDGTVWGDIGALMQIAKAVALLEESLDGGLNVLIEALAGVAVEDVSLGALVLGTRVLTVVLLVVLLRLLLVNLIHILAMLLNGLVVADEDVAVVTQGPSLFLHDLTTVGMDKAGMDVEDALDTTSGFTDGLEGLLGGQLMEGSGSVGLDDDVVIVLDQLLDELAVLVSTEVVGYIQIKTIDDKGSRHIVGSQEAGNATETTAPLLIDDKSGLVLGIAAINKDGLLDLLLCKVGIRVAAATAAA